MVAIVLGSPKTSAWVVLVVLAVSREARRWLAGSRRARRV
jgi:hypothetical protein